MRKILAVLVLVLVLPLATAEWKYQTKEKVYDFQIMDYNGDGKEEIAIGSDFLYIVDFDGNLLKKFEYPALGFDFSKVFLVSSFALGGKDSGYLIDYYGNLKAECIIDGDLKFSLIRDIDSDARKEMIFATENEIYLFYRNGNPKHSRSIPEIKKIESEDIDGDGNLEVIVAADKFYVLDKDFNTLWYCCTDTNDFLLHDFDGDGLKEIVIAGDELRFYKKNGLMYWKIPLDKEAVDVFLGDYNSDGTDDIVVLDKYAIAAYDKEGTKIWEFGYPTSKDLKTVYIGDLDGDETNEIILGAGNHIAVLQGEETLAQYSTTYTNDEIFKIHARDLNGDGKKEILASSWRFLNVFTYEKQEPKEEEKEEEETEEKEEEEVDLEAKKEQAQSLYNNAGDLFNNKEYTKAKDNFVQAKSLYEEIGDTDMTDVCDIFISKAYKGINGGKHWDSANEKEKNEDYEGAIEEYEKAKEFYVEVDQEKADLCTQKIAEMEDKQKFSGILKYVPIIVFLVAILALIGYTVRMVMKKR
ncbi:MAG: VCBS repeat-containing protein [Euryarchaeota archaeon]|nr:VCBS repeat-containing protein [Euryarchaeota archaeon]